MMQLDDVQQKQQQQQQQQHFIDDDDNAAIESDTSKTHDEYDEEEDSPLLIALDDLESRVVSALNEFKSHSGRASHHPSSTNNNIHEELSSVLRPVVEISSHTGPSTARSLAATYPHMLNVDLCVDEMYTRLNSELILPVILECAQSDTVPSKRSACLALFHTLHIEWQKAGSYMDSTTSVPSLAGPYGPGVSNTAANNNIVSAPPYSASDATRRNHIRSMRKSELLRRWVQSALPNLAPGAYTSSTLDCSVASRGVLSASAALKPCLRYMAERIGNADDAGALRLFLPVMRMIAGVLGRMFLERSSSATSSVGGRAGAGENVMASDSLRATCIKFLEIVILCFSNRAIPGAAAGSHAALRMQKGGGNKDANDFALEDLPPGHPIITREGLEEIGEYCFSTLRGLVLLGGQAAIDPSLLVAATTAASSLGGKDCWDSVFRFYMLMLISLIS
jgi:symplekin